jgi:hypothetical protein
LSIRAVGRKAKYYGAKADYSRGPDKPRANKKKQFIADRLSRRPVDTHSHRETTMPRAIPPEPGRSRVARLPMKKTIECQKTLQPMCQATVSTLRSEVIVESYALYGVIGLRFVYDPRISAEPPRMTCAL